MGEIYSKPGSTAPQPHQNSSTNNPQISRSREVLLPGVSGVGVEHLSNAALDVLSRFQANSAQVPTHTMQSRSVVSPDQIYGTTCNVRSGRFVDTQSTNALTRTLTPEEMLAAAQLCGQLNSSQFQAFAAVYHQQQQQLQRAGVSSVSAASGLSQHIPGISFAQALAAVTSVKTSPSNQSLNSHVTSYVSRQPLSYSTQAQLSQKRPPSGHSQFHSGHSAQIVQNSNNTRPASASQAVMQQRQGILGICHVNQHGNAPQYTASAPFDSTSGLFNVHHPSHSTTRASPISPSPANNLAYQGRRPQLAPPTSHPNKRPRMSTGSQQSHSVSVPLCLVTNSTTATGMDGLMGSVVVNKTMASIAAGQAFLNANTYATASEAAAVAAAALSPLFTATMSHNLTSPSSTVGTTNPVSYQSHLVPSHQRPVGSVGNSTFHQQQILTSISYPTTLIGSLSGSVLNSINNRTSFSHVPNLGQGFGSSANFGAQPACSISNTHISTKQSHPSIAPQSPSRLISGHLHHPHLPTHPTQHNFHHTSHPLQQSNAPHHMMGHANLPQGSGVLRQQTKEPAYHPQVEAISPAPDESRLVDAQDAKLLREREEINRQLTVLDADINKQESHLRSLCERKARLTARLASAPVRSEGSNANMNDATLADRNSFDNMVDHNSTTVGTESAILNKPSDFERNYENPIQAIISDNRQRTRQRHLIFTRLCGPTVKPGPYALPFYRQPSDLPSLRALQVDFHNHFRPKLIHYIRRRARAEQSRIRLLAQQYARHSRLFTKKMDKLLSSTKRRQRDLRHRDIFEKALPEVRKNREDREMGNSDYPKTTLEDGSDSDYMSGNNLSDDTQATPYDPLEEMNKLKEYAIDPPILLGPWQRRYQFICESGLVTDCRAQLQETQDLSKWTDEEKQIFKERFLMTPKNFTSIATHLERKTVAECIRYYYLSKKKEGYKQLLKKHNARRRRAAQTERGGGTGGGTNSSAHGSGGSGTSGGANNHQSLPPASGAYNSSTNSAHSPPHSDANGGHVDSSGGFKNPVNADSNRNQDGENKDHESTKFSSKKESGAVIGHISTSGRSRHCRGRPPTTHAQTQSGQNTSEELPTGSQNRGRSQLKIITESTESSLIDSGTKILDIRSHMHGCDGATISSSAALKSESYPYVSASTMCPAATSLSLSSSVSTCIKDIIHFAIKKNLTTPCSSEPPSSRIPLSVSKISGDITSPSSLMFEPSGTLGVDLSTLPSPINFPSSSAAEIYAAAARFAAANASALNTDMTAVYVATAAAVAAVNVGGDQGLENLAVNSSIPSAVSLSPKPDLPNYALEGTDSTKRWQMSVNPPWGAVTSVRESGTNLMNPTSSKAILLGDFLTAQQLERADSANWGTNLSVTSPSRLACTNSMTLSSRSIDPSTLPLPINRSSRSPTGSKFSDQISQDANRFPPSLLSDKILNTTSSAEHALRLALQAQAVIAAASAVGTVHELNTSAVERCVYSPLSPTPAKPEISSSIDTQLCSRVVNSGMDSPQYLSASMLSRKLSTSPIPVCLNSDSSIVAANAAQVASFVANANRRYVEEVESYTTRDRSDSMRTLTSSEASQFYGVLRHLRQQKQDQLLQSPQISAIVTSTGLNPSHLSFSDSRDPVGYPPRPHSFDTDPSMLDSIQPHFLTHHSQHSQSHDLSSSLDPDSPGFIGGYLSNMKRSYLFHEPPAPLNDEALASEARYRRRGYTESQINLRFAAATPTVPSSIPNRTSPEKLVHSARSSPHTFESDVPTASTFTAASYIDALIYSHLNRGSRISGDKPITTTTELPTTKRQNVDYYDCPNSKISPSDTVKDTKLPTHRHDSNSQYMASTNNTSLSAGTCAPETQAIDAEVVAQSLTNHLTSSCSSSETRSPHLSETSSPVAAVQLTRTTLSTDAHTTGINVPLKKRDCQTSSSPSVIVAITSITTNSVDAVNVNDPESLFPKFSRANTCTLGLTTCAADGSSFRVTNQEYIRKVKMNTHLPADADLSGSNLPEGTLIGTRSLSAVTNTPDLSNKGIISHVTFISEHSSRNQSPSIGSDVDSPGKLQIDLAAPDFQSNVTEACSDPSFPTELPATTATEQSQDEWRNLGSSIFNTFKDKVNFHDQTTYSSLSSKSSPLNMSPSTSIVYHGLSSSSSAIATTVENLGS